MTCFAQRLLPGLALVLAATTGCASSDADDPSSQAPAESSTSAAPTPEESETPEAPAVEPASGPLLKINGVTARAPQGWRVRQTHISGWAAPPDKVGVSMMLWQFPAFDDETIEDTAEMFATSNSFDKPLKRRDDVTIDGVTFFHLTGQVTKGEYMERFGFVNLERKKRQVLDFTFKYGQGPKMADTVVAPVLASVDIR